MSVCCIVAARMPANVPIDSNERRLPGKVLMELSGITILHHVVNRLRESRLIDEIIIASTKNPLNESIIKECNKIDVKYFLGDEEDVLNRFYEVSKQSKADTFVRVSADCPLLDPQINDMVIKLFLDGRGRFDYGSNADNVNKGLMNRRTFPRGLDIEVFSAEALKRAYQYDRSTRAHVTPYMYTHLNEFCIFRLENWKDYSDYRWTVDTVEDLKMMRQIFENLYGKNDSNPYPDYKDVVDFLDERPEIKEINRQVEQMGAYVPLVNKGNDVTRFQLTWDGKVREIEGREFGFSRF